MNKKQFEKLEKKTIKNIDLIPEDTDYCYTIDREKIKDFIGRKKKRCDKTVSIGTGSLDCAFKAKSDRMMRDEMEMFDRQMVFLSSQ